MRRRARCSAVTVAISLALSLALSLVLTACSSGSSTTLGAPHGQPCAPTPTGHLCIKVVARHAIVGDVIAYLSASESPLAGTTWRLVLSTYACAPGTGRTARCAEMASYPAAARTGVPPAATSCRDTTGAAVTSAPGCHDTLAQAMATHGDWTGFMSSGNAVTEPRPTWFCVSEQVRTGAGWQPPDVGVAPTPTRACAEVHA